MLKSVETMDPDEHGVWRLTDLFGDEKTVERRIKEMNLVNHRIFFERS